MEGRKRGIIKVELAFVEKKLNSEFVFGLLLRLGTGKATRRKAEAGKQPRITRKDEQTLQEPLEALV